MSEHVYADYAAATPIDDRVVSAMSEASKEFGNPSSRHSFGKSAHLLLDQSRQTIARFLNCVESELVFTSSGTESNNLAILGIARANREKGQHIITSSIEHPSIINACRALERDGFSVTYLAPENDGVISPKALQAALTAETTLVSIHLANSEIGIAQDIPTLSAVTHQHSSAIFHTDACQAAAYLDLDVKELGVDSLTFNGSKIYGPKGVAVLYVKETTDIFPVMYGGGQEKSLRSGTENIPGIVGLATAVETVMARRNEDTEKIGTLRDSLETSLIAAGASINVRTKQRLPNHLSVTLVNCQESDVVRAMDERGISVSSGSACSSKSLADSHVLNAIGLTSEQINKTLRISLGRNTNQTEIQKIAAAIIKINQ